MDLCKLIYLLIRFCSQRNGENWRSQAIPNSKTFCFFGCCYSPSNLGYRFVIKLKDDMLWLQRLLQRTAKESKVNKRLSCYISNIAFMVTLTFSPSYLPFSCTISSAKNLFNNLEASQMIPHLFHRSFPPLREFFVNIRFLQLSQRGFVFEIVNFR